MNTRFQDLGFQQLNDGTVRLEQTDYAGETVLIDAHPEQILFIARRLCGMTTATASNVADLERRIAVLNDKLQHIVCNGTFRSDLIEGLDDGFEYLAKLDGLLDLALEFDGGRLDPEPSKALSDASEPRLVGAGMDRHAESPPRAIVEAGEQLGLAV